MNFPERFAFADLETLQNLKEYVSALTDWVKHEPWLNKFAVLSKTAGKSTYEYATCCFEARCPKLP